MIRIKHQQGIISYQWVIIQLLYPWVTTSWHTSISGNITQLSLMITPWPIVSGATMEAATTSHSAAQSALARACAAIVEGKFVCFVCNQGLHRSVTLCEKTADSVDEKPQHLDLERLAAFCHAKSWHPWAG
jgi:hypothetical protein